MFTKPFKNLSKTDTDSAGGKGASLGEMTQVGIQIPPGFVLLTNAFDRFLDETDLRQEVQSELDGVEQDKMHTVEHASERIQAMILKAKIPKDITEEIQKAFKKLNVKYVAVRSSATAEDSSTATWAGQLDSFLNTTEENLLENVCKCWASLFTPRAIFYRFEQNLHKQKISVAVVIQKMVESEKSGIAFSVHPVTQDKNQLIIEAGYGLGEAIVSGSITPDGYVVEKKPRRIIDKNINTQKRKLVRAENGGNEWRDMLKEKGEKPVLDGGQIMELTDLILKIEDHYKTPQDVEWAFEKSKFYITQSRPITTLGNKRSKIEAKIKSEYHKVTNRSMVLLDCEIWDQAERIELPKIYDNCVAYDPVFVYKPKKAITVYYNFSDSHQDTSELIDYFSQKKNPFDISRKKFDKESKITSKLTRSDEAEDFEPLFKSIIKIWPLISISISIGDQDDTKSLAKQSLIKKCRKLRLENEDILHVSTEAILDKATYKVPDKYKEWVGFLTYKEIQSGVLPTFVELKKRSTGYVYHKGVLYSGEDIASYAQRKGFLIIEELATRNEVVKNGLNGTVAYAGKINGYVKIVFENKDINIVSEGDILVTPMTTPNLLPAMKKAVAFVTDEGGITCHASIIAREMGKPCIIGTKIATQVFKDGDLVEVDANKGVVSMLEKSKKL